MSRRFTLLSTCAIVGVLAAAVPDARADDAIQAEIALLKAQLRRLEAKVDAQERRDRAAKTAPRPKAEPAQVAAAPGVLVPASASGPLPTLIACPPGKICYKGITFTPGGFVALEDVFRSRFIGADIGTPYGAIPLNNNRAGHAQEFRFSARQSRISGLVEGQVDPATKLSAYGEFDFLGAAQTANSNESNSFNLRIRHLYGTIDRTDLGVHVLAGQTWSLATTNTIGIVPRKGGHPAHDRRAIRAGLRLGATAAASRRQGHHAGSRHRRLARRSGHDRVRYASIGLHLQSGGGRRRPVQ